MPTIMVVTVRHITVILLDFFLSKTTVSEDGFISFIRWRNPHAVGSLRAAVPRETREVVTRSEDSTTPKYRTVD
jgi:hypothetical protein